MLNEGQDDPSGNPVVGALDARCTEFLFGDQLLHRVGSPAPWFGPVRHHVAGLDQLFALRLLFQRREFGGINPASDGVLTAPKGVPAPGDPNPAGTISYWTGELDAYTPDYAYIYEWRGTGGGGNNCPAGANQGHVRLVHDPVRKGPKP